MFFGRSCEGNLRAARRNTAQDAGLYREATLDVLENGPIRNIQDELEQAFNSLSEPLRTQAQDHLDEARAILRESRSAADRVAARIAAPLDGREEGADVVRLRA